MADQNQAQLAGMQAQLPLDLPSIILGFHAANMMSQMAQNKSTVQGGKDQQASPMMGLMQLLDVVRGGKGGMGGMGNNAAQTDGSAAGGGQDKSAQAQKKPAGGAVGGFMQILHALGGGE